MIYNLEFFKQEANRRYWAFVGQNATTGSPHPITGKYSCYGKMVCFKTKSSRDNYVKNWRSPNSSEFIVKCTPQTARKYSLGQSLIDYYTDLYYTEYAD